jgi:hypothetical protein
MYRINGKTKGAQAICIVIRFVSTSAQFGTSTVVRLKGKLEFLHLASASESVPLGPRRNGLKCETLHKVYMSGA